MAAVREEGVGQRYLIEHSAGSGKTNTIAWTAHRLARLHVDDEKVFDSVNGFAESRIAAWSAMSQAITTGRTPDQLGEQQCGRLPRAALRS